MLCAWLKNDCLRHALLRAVSDLALPQGMIAAGCIRNLVWDKLHHTDTQINDVDVIFYAPHQLDIAFEQSITAELRKRFPELTWDVKNQARMHLKHNDRPYTGCADAMAFWVEKETAIGAFVDASGEIQLVAPFGLESLMQGKLTPNPRRPADVFHQRLSHKRWTSTWPSLSVQKR